MERSEPTLVPEWYKFPTSSLAGSGNFNHQSGFSLHSDEHNIGYPSRSRLSVSVCNYDAPRSSSSSERTLSSFRRSATGNGYTARKKDISSHVYNSFGRSHRDRDMDREKDIEIHENDRKFFPDNGFGDYPDAFTPNKSEKEPFCHSQSGRRADSWLKRVGHDSSNDIQTSGINKLSFELEFPSLGAEEKLVVSDEIRESSSSIEIGAAEVPIVGDNGLIVSSAPNSSTGLNMAETVAQAPARARTVSHLPNDSQKFDEFHRQQILKLRPVTPSMPKNSGVNQAEKSKAKAVKTVPHLPSQLVNNTFRSIVKTEASKSSQPGNFLILNREKTGAFPVEKDNSNSGNGRRIAASPSGTFQAGISLLKSQVNPKLNVDGRVNGLTSSSLGDRKPPPQNRNDFFNSLRMKTSSSNQENISQNSNCSLSTSPKLEKVDEEASISDKDKGVSSEMLIFQCSVENGDFSGTCKAVAEPEKLVSDEEEVAFLRSLGWEENAGEEALTPEEIESFLSEHEDKMPVSKLKTAL